MAYQKTAKDLAWDKERTKLRSEANYWQLAYGQKERECQMMDEKIAALQKENEKLRAAITELTKGEMTPDEVIAKMRKQSELADLMKLMVNCTSGIF